MRVVISDRTVYGKEDVRIGDKIGVIVNGLLCEGEVQGLSYRGETRCNMHVTVYDRIEAKVEEAEKVEVKPTSVPTNGRSGED